MSKLIFLAWLMGICSCIFAQWKLVEPLTPDVLCVSNIQFITDEIGYVSCYNTIGKTTDAGETWIFNNEHIGSFLNVQFINPDTGMVCCDPDEGKEVMMTFDGGETWTFPDVDPYTFSVTDLKFFESGRTLMINCDVGGIVFFHTVNDYYTEYEGTVTELGGLYCFDMEFFDEDTGYIAGLFDLSGSGVGSQTIRTTDGGYTWTESSTWYGPDLALSFPSAKVGYGYSELDQLWKTTDYADTWDTLTWVFNEDVPGFTFKKVYFYDENVGFLITQFGVPDHYEVLRTINGGISWDTTFFESDIYDDKAFIDIYCTGADTCYLTSTAGIFKTTNGAGFPVYPVEINNYSQAPFSISPVPATSVISINSQNKNEIKQIITTNYLGEKINITWDAELKADISNLPSGIYFTEIITEQNKGVQKWVKL
jgi:photosystem II stability/assembly factor-like uncharacterized protein